MNVETFKSLIRLINISPRAALMNTTFEELKTLFETDPAAAEERVKEIMTEYIASLDPERKKRAEAFNWRLQQDLRNFRDPQARLNRMVERFWVGVKEFQLALKGEHPNQVLDQQGKPSDVVKFPTDKT